MLCEAVIEPKVHFRMTIIGIKSLTRKNIKKNKMRKNAHMRNKRETLM